MNSNLLIRRVVALSFVLMSGMLLSAGASAQDYVRCGALFDNHGWYYLEEEEAEERGLMRSSEWGGGFFLYNQNFTSNQDIGFVLYNQNFGNTPDVPLGSGLLILATAGAGYAIGKRKNNKNRLS